MSIKLPDGSRIQIDIDPNETPEEKEKRNSWIRNIREQRAKILQQDNKEQKIMNILTSKRIALVISIILCAVLYLSFLSAFTTKRDTYICYTTKTGECFHSATCKYLNTAYETTVYEASRRYRVCNYCNPCQEIYKTTFTSRDYITPLLISLPISALTFVILTAKKKEQ